MESIKRDYPKAAKLYQSTCDDYGFPRSCFKFASYSVTGKGCKADPLRAFEYFKKGCTLGEKDSCLYAGLMCVAQNETVNVKKDYPQGIEFLRKSCDGGNNNACFYLSGMYISGIPGVLEKDMKVAYDFTNKGCELGNIYSCVNLSQMYAKGDGVEKNEQLAAKYKAKALEMENQLKANFRQIQFEQGTS